MLYIRLDYLFPFVCIISVSGHVVAAKRETAKGSQERLVKRVKNTCKFFFYVVRTMHFGMKLYNDQRNAQVFNLFIYFLLPNVFWAFFQPIFRGRCTNSAVIQVFWVWCQRPGADIIHYTISVLLTFWHQNLAFKF
jgi:hypothetical protein